MTNPQPEFDLSIVIPAYNEGPRIGRSLERLAAYLREHPMGKVEVIVVEQNHPSGAPPDNTAEVAAGKAHLFHYIRLLNIGPRRGKGHAVREGIFEARGRYIMFMDTDLATPLRHLADVKAFMDRDGQIGIAVRQLFKIHKGLRKIITSGGNLMTQVLLVPGIKDTQCGFKVFRADIARDVFARMTMQQWSFDMEILAIARRRGYKIDSFMASDWKDPKAEGKGLVGDSTIKVALKTFWDPFKIRWNIWTGRYNHPHYRHHAWQ